MEISEPLTKLQVKAIDEQYRRSVETHSKSIAIM